MVKFFKSPELHNKALRHNSPFGKCTIYMSGSNYMSDLKIHVGKQTIIIDHFPNIFAQRLLTPLLCFLESD